MIHFGATLDKRCCRPISGVNKAVGDAAVNSQGQGSDSAPTHAFMHPQND